MIQSPDSLNNLSGTSPAHADTDQEGNSFAKTNPAQATSDSGFVFSDLKTDSAISILPSVNPPAQVNLFENHLLHLNHYRPEAINHPRPDWLFIAVMIVFAALAMVKALYSRNLQQIISAFFKTSVTNQIVRDENMLLQRASVLLTILFNIVVALYLYLISVRSGWHTTFFSHGVARFIIFALCISFIYTGKFIILKLAGLIFNADRLVSAYIFNIFLINNVLGLALIPLVVMIAFSGTVVVNYCVIISVVLIGLSFLFRIGRGVIISVSGQHFSVMYLILYLCALELAPLAILIKLFVQ